MGRPSHLPLPGPPVVGMSQLPIDWFSLAVCDLDSSRAAAYVLVLISSLRHKTKRWSLNVADEYRQRLEHQMQAEIDTDVERRREHLQSSYAKGIEQWVDDFRNRVEQLTNGTERSSRPPRNLLCCRRQADGTGGEKVVPS